MMLLDALFPYIEAGREKELGSWKEEGRGEW